MFILDSLLVGGLRFVLDKVAAAVDAELNDDERLRERLLEAQMRAELGEIGDAELAAVEADVVARLREIRDRRQGGSPAVLAPHEYRIAGVEASVAGDEHEP